MFVLEYSFTVAEHDPERPWIVLGSDQHTITLDDGRSFFEWAHERWPAPRWTVELDPWQLGREWPGSVGCWRDPRNPDATRTS
jgi:hypothetical protein